MKNHGRRRQPWDWVGQLIQLALITGVTVVAAVVAYGAAMATAYLLSGGPPPLPAGWRNTVVHMIFYLVFFGLLIPGIIRCARYLRSHRGRLL